MQPLGLMQILNNFLPAPLFYGNPRFARAQAPAPSAMGMPVNPDVTGLQVLLRLLSPQGATYDQARRQSPIVPPPQNPLLMTLGQMYGLYPKTMPPAMPQPQTRQASAPSEQVER